MPKFTLTLKGAFAFFVYAEEIEVHVPLLKEHTYVAEDGTYRDKDPEARKSFDYSKQPDRHYCIHVKGSTHQGRFDPSRNVVLSGFHPSPNVTPRNRLCVFHITTPDSINSCDLVSPDLTSNNQAISPTQPLFMGRHSSAVTARKFANGHEFIYKNALEIDISPALGELRPQDSGLLFLIAEDTRSGHDRLSPAHATMAFDASMKLMHGVDLSFADQFHFKEDGENCAAHPLAPRACNGGTSVL